jgi:hypothetical protein
MGADKNSSRRMNSAYAPNSQPRVPTRVLPRSHRQNGPTDPSNKPKQSQGKTETQEAKDLGNMQWPGQTVRMEGADYPWAPGGPSASSWRTVRNWFPNLQ